MAAAQRAAAPTLSDLAREALTAHEGRVGHAAQALAVELRDDRALLSAVVQRAVTDVAIFARPASPSGRPGGTTFRSPAAETPTCLADWERWLQVTPIDTIIDRFGGMRALARTLGHANHTTVQGWKERGFISEKQIPCAAFALNKLKELASGAILASHREMIDAIGCASLALALGLPIQTVAAWKGRDSIPCWRWRAVEEEARKRRLPGITYEAIETAFNHRRRDKAGPRLPTL